jgi:acetoin utilization deacetylase AcuC-like enzyme
VEGRILIATHPACAGHLTGPDHPERPERLEAALAALRGDPELAARCDLREGVPATEEDLLRVHGWSHVEALRAAAAEAHRRGGLVWLDEDTPVSAGSWDAALAAAGCAITATEAVLDGEAGSAFALARPPGHHATADRAMGFCLVNNVAVAIRRAQARRRASRVLVVDWDAHHGNGTQELFYDDPSVYVLSLHESPGYPGTGVAGETGAGPGAGTTRNVPLGVGTAGEAYRARHREALAEALARFEPDLAVVSAGFDALAGDPEAGLLLEPADLHSLATDLLAQLPARSKVVAVLEGGYLLGSLGRGVVAFLRGLAGLPPR